MEFVKFSAHKISFTNSQLTPERGFCSKGWYFCRTSFHDSVVLQNTALGWRQFLSCRKLMLV